MAPLKLKLNRKINTVKINKHIFLELSRIHFYAIPTFDITYISLFHLLQHKVTPLELEKIKKQPLSYNVTFPPIRQTDLWHYMHLTSPYHLFTSHLVFWRTEITGKVWERLMMLNSSATQSIYIFGFSLHSLTECTRFSFPLCPHYLRLLSHVPSTPQHCQILVSIKQSHRKFALSCVPFYHVLIETRIF